MIESAGNFLVHAHRWIETNYPEGNFASDPIEKQKVLDFVSKEYDTFVLA